MSETRAAITIVTFNSARYISGCLQFALAQDHRPLRIVVIDNASKDGTVEILRQHQNRVRVIYNRENTGFAAGQNQAMAEVPDAEWILVLNPDVRLAPDFLSRLLAAAQSMPEVGSVCGKLLSVSSEFVPASPPLIDSTGIRFSESLRHFDRGNGVPDRGQYESAEYVFGGTGAACLYRRAMIDDISISGEFFDSDFFVYREDADVAWRAQLLGWRCFYIPRAVGQHVRVVTPEKRRAIAPLINMHSVKNRWLMRIKNITPDLYRRFWLPITLRDIVVVGGCLLREWSSLAAFSRVIRLWKRMLGKRREIMRRRRADDEYLARWFRSDAGHA
jgi:GT2 family glycosyltransferase